MVDHRWRGYEHKELHTMINGGPGVSASHPLEDRWGGISEALGKIDGDLQNALTKMGASWEGSTATATQAALSPLAEWASDAQTGASVMKTSATMQADYIADARKKMPEVVEVTTEAPGFWDKAAGAMTGPIGMMDVINQQQDHERQEAAQENAQAQAVKVMEDYESASTTNRETLGTFNPPPQVVIDTPPPSGTTDPNANVGYNTGKTSGFTSGNDTTNTSWTAPPSGPPAHTTPGLGGGGTTNPSWVEPPKAQPTPVPPVLPTPTPGPGSGQHKTGLPVPPVFTRPDGSGTGRGGPGGAGTGKGGLGGKAFGPMSGGLGGPGSGMKPGMAPMAGAFGADDMHANRGAGAGAAGKPGAAGGMGAGGAAGRGQGEGDEDTEHKVADYLVEAGDVFGDERLVAPPVIGGAPEA